MSMWMWTWTGQDLSSKESLGPGRLWLWFDMGRDSPGHWGTKEKPPSAVGARVGLGVPEADNSNDHHSHHEDQPSRGRAHNEGQLFLELQGTGA